MTNRDHNHCVIAVYESAAGAVDGVRALLRSGWDIERLSVVGRDSSNSERVVGLYTAGRRTKFWAVQAESWNALSDELRDSSIFIVPRLGPIIVIGPLVDGFVATLESIQAPAAVGIVAAAIARVGVPLERAAYYESCVDKGRIVIVGPGEADPVAHTHEILDGTRPIELASYPA